VRSAVSVFLSTFFALVAALSLAACVKKGGEAEVVGRDYIPATYSSTAGEEGRELVAEQWILLVRMRDDAKRIRISVDLPEWEKAKAGDRVKVSYSQGKYTGTVWAAELK
jgi:hypothetical protein